MYAALYHRLGSYPYDRDPARPGWFATVPNASWADPDSAGWFDGTAAHEL
jgi:glucarate dehydratase